MLQHRRGAMQFAPAGRVACAARCNYQLLHLLAGLLVHELLHLLEPLVLHDCTAPMMPDFYPAKPDRE